MTKNFFYDIIILTKKRYLKRNTMRKQIKELLNQLENKKLTGENKQELKKVLEKLKRIKNI